jgi:DNA-binding NarL/FixJ family response regulator
MQHLTILTRDLTPYEHLIAGLLCEGLSNSAIGAKAAHTK